MPGVDVKDGKDNDGDGDKCILFAFPSNHNA